MKTALVLLGFSIGTILIVGFYVYQKLKNVFNGFYDDAEGW